MVYVGSKSRIAKEIIPIIESYITPQTEFYIEPFVGGANVIDKINFSNKLAFDIHKELISMFQHIQKYPCDIPTFISEEYYKYVRQEYKQNGNKNIPSWKIGLVGFCASYGSKFFDGYARNGEDERLGKVKPRNTQMLNNLYKQQPNLQNIKFECCHFLNLNPSDYKNCLFYCDPPYKNTTKYKTDPFPYDDFYKWCEKLSENNIVLVSEYELPPQFRCIWQKKTKTLLNSNRNSNDATNNRIEKLFIFEKQKN